MKLDEGNQKIKFCPYCGKSLDEGARFCKYCGAAIAIDQKAMEPEGDYYTVRKSVFEGRIHKCPNCGEVLTSFTSVCPACGYEIRDAKSSKTVENLSNKLNEITSRQMPPVEESTSIMKTIFGRDFKKVDHTENMNRKAEFENLKHQAKADTIINYPVPNTKEDIMEFMLLAAANIESNKNLEKTERQAWITKLDQVYRKAQITIKNPSDLADVQSIYERQKAIIRCRSIFKRGVILIVIGILFLMAGADATAESSGAIFIGLILVAIGIYMIANTNCNKKRR